MKEKKYIHRKVTHQSDFLPQLPNVTGVLLGTRGKQNVDGGSVMLIRQSCPTRSLPQANPLRIVEEEGDVWSKSSL